MRTVRRPLQDLANRGKITILSSRFHKDTGEAIFEIAVANSNDAAILGREMFTNSGRTNLKELASLIETNGHQNSGR